MLETATQDFERKNCKHIKSLAQAAFKSITNISHCLEQTKKGVESAARKYQGKWIKTRNVPFFFLII